MGAYQLIDAALNALMQGVESPSLPLLAGLSRREEGDAHELFRAVISELDLAPPTPVNTEAERWKLVRLLCEAIAQESIEPEVAGRLIWFQGWSELDYPDALQPLIGWVSEWEDWTPSWNVDRDHYRRRIVEEARRLLAGLWPLSDPTVRAAMRTVVDPRHTAACWHRLMTPVGSPGHLTSRRPLDVRAVGGRA